MSHSQSNNLKRLGLFLGALFVIVVLSMGIYLFNPRAYQTTAVFTDISLKADQKTQLEDLVIVKLSGKPYELGYQHGTLLKTEIREIIRIMHSLMQFDRFPLGLVSRLKVNYQTLAYYRATPVNYQQEMQGVADGAGVALADIVMLNVYDELANLSQCTNVAVWGEESADGKIIHGRNLDYNLQKYLWNRQVIFVYEPEEGYRLVSVTWPGVIGSLTGMNERGLTLGSMTSQANEKSIHGVPTGILYRLVLQESANLSQTEEILRTHPRTIGNNLMITSALDGRGLVFELTASRVEKWSEANRAASTNHFNILENSFHYSAESEHRQNRAGELIDEHLKIWHTPIGLNQMRMILDDRFVGSKGGYTRCIGNYENVQSVIFFPEELNLWIGINDAVPAASGPYWGFHFEPDAVEPLDYLGRTAVHESYLTSQSWFHRDPAYWTPELVEKVLARNRERSKDSTALLWEEGDFYLRIKQYQAAIDNLETLLQKMGSQFEKSLDETNHWRTIEKTDVYLKLANAYYGEGLLDRAQEMVELVLNEPGAPEYLKKSAKALQVKLQAP